jgi:hypothetical protein
VGDSNRSRGNPKWKEGKVPRGAKPFRKGVSGNPRGSSQSARLAHLLNRQLNEVVDGDPKGRTAGQLAMRALIKEALRGNVRAAEICLNRIDGAVPQQVAQMTPDEAAQTLAEMLGVEPKELIASIREEPED